MWFACGCGQAATNVKCPLQMITAVLFDVDGTLIRTGGAGVRAFAMALRSEFGVEDCVQHVAFAGRTDLSLVRELFQLAGIPHTRANIDRFFNRYLEWLPRMLVQSNGSVLNGAVKFIQSLRASDSPPVLGLLTGNIRRGAELKLKHFGLWEYFQVGAFGDEYEDRNRIAALALDRVRDLLCTHIPAEQVVVVGDTPHDVACARAIGARSLAVATGGASKAALAGAGPDWLVDDLGQVTLQTLGGTGSQQLYLLPRC